jgi:hypothetical protein
MQANTFNREPFINFKHSFLLRGEIDYKREALVLGRRALQLHQWHQWRSETGRILQAAKEACKQKNSANLLEHRYGQQGSYKALYRVKTADEIRDLESALFDFFLGGDSSPDSFAVRFDQFANYLRANSLGCNWDFVAYLAFLYNPQRYFPIRSTRFDSLLKFYKVPQSIAGHVIWDRYQVLLDLAEELKEKLSFYGTADAIEIQSYMWVVSYLIKEGKVSPHRPSVPFDPDAELTKRVKSAAEKERIGLQGERFVLDKEIDRLKRAGRNDLASKVRIVAVEGDSRGFDILSFTLDENELHIEVKTTTRSPTNDNGFWLSNNEKKVAEQDNKWVVYRVWNIDTTPTCENLGNIVRKDSEEWELTPSTWYVKPINPKT